MCAGIPTLDLATRVVLVMHKSERHRPTATAPILLQALPNHAWQMHGDPGTTVDLNDHWSEQRQGLLLFPSVDAVELSPSMLDGRPVTLVVPDGSWRQASKAARRLLGAERFTPVKLPPGPHTRYRLRRENRLGGLATAEAIARAMGILEGADVGRQLEQVFETMVTRRLEQRG